MLLGVGQIAAAAGNTSFQKGVVAYEAGQYSVAAQAFQDSLTAQPAAGTLLNLGLAEWHRGRTGEAILAWEQSAWLDPFNGAARNNLLYAHETTSASPLELTWYEQASTWLPAADWAWIAGGSLWLAVALVTLPGFLRMRKAGWHQSLAALALGIFLLSLPAYFGIFTRSEMGIVLKNNTVLRLTPTASAETIASLPAGEPARRLRTQGSYYYLRTPYGAGWVEARQIKFVCPH